jgi:hypothetical protein
MPRHTPRRHRRLIQHRQPQPFRHSAIVHIQLDVRHPPKTQNASNPPCVPIVRNARSASLRACLELVERPAVASAVACPLFVIPQPSGGICCQQLFLTTGCFESKVHRHFEPKRLTHL